MLVCLTSCLNCQEDQELLESAEIAHHKKLCIQLKRAERKVLQNALKYAATTRSKTSDERNSNAHDDKSPANDNASDRVDETTSAIDQLCVDGQ